MNRSNPATLFRSACAALSFALAAAAQAADPVGHTPGEFSVDPTGAANYRIPIVVPPGIAGMQPDLALLYSSRAGNGQLGAGWSISGLSAITRCPKTKAQDGATYLDGVDFDLEDRLCLDGQHLLYADTTPTDTEYWAATSYSTEIASFQKITGVTPNGALGHASFIVEDKAGLKRFYGDSTDSKIEVKGITPNPPTMMWAVRRIEDKYKNYITFSYVETANGEHRPSEITWQNSQGFQAGKAVFEYSDARPDKVSGYLPGGGLVALTQRLTAVKVYARTTLVRRYNLAYWLHPVSGLSHLASVTECNGAGECLRPTSFTWEDNAGGFNLYNTRMFFTEFNALRFGDMDGDGRTDKIYKKDGTVRIQYGGQYSGHVDTGIDISQSDFDNSVVLDYNGDGRQDLLVAQGGWRLMQASATTRTLAFTDIVANSYSMNNNHPKPFALDIDGDGKSELIARNGSDHLVIWMNGVGGFGGFNATPVDTGFTVDANTRIMPFEYNGDGRPDLLVYYKDSLCYSSCPTAVGILVNTGSGFTHAGSGPGTHNGDTREHLMVLDANGDGLSDVLVAQDLTSTIDKWYLYVNNGNGSFASSGVLPLTVHHATAAQSLDHNGDGKADLMFAHNGKWWIAYSTGTGFGTDAQAVDTTIDDGGSNRESATLADFDGDGNADLFRVYGSEGDQWKMYWAAGVRNGQLRNVVDGLGANIAINYWPLSEPFAPSVADGALYGDLYSKDVSDDPLPPSLPAPEYRDFNGPIQVVREFWTHTGASSAASNDPYIHTQYHYAGAKLNNWGRGFAGFRRIFAVNGNLGTRTVNYHRLDFPYAGMVEVARQSTQDILTELTLQQPQNEGRSRCTNPEGEPVHADGCQTAYQPRYDATIAPGKLVSLTTNTFDSVDLAAPNFSKIEPDYQYPYAKVGKYPFVKTTEVKHHDFTQAGEPLIKREYTRHTNDVCGNATNVYTITDKNGSGETVGSDGHTVNAVNTYSDSTACLGRLTQAAVTHTRPTYAGSGNAALTSVARTSTFGYNALGYLNQEVIQGAGGLNLTKDYGIDPTFGNRISETVTGTGVNRVTSTTYDANGQFVVAVQNALGQRETRTWDYRFGAQTSVTGPNGLTTVWQYDDFGRKTNEIAPRDTVTTGWTYNWCEPAGTCARADAKYYVTATGSDGSSNITEYDRVGRAILASKWGIGDAPSGGVAQPKRVLSETHYDRLGRAYATSLPYFAGAANKCWVFRSFDPLGRVVAEHKADAEADCSGTSAPAPDAAPAGYGHVTTTEYIGLVTRASLPVTATTFRHVERETNVMGRLRFIRELNGSGTATLQWQKLDNNWANVETEYDYDVFGNTTWVQDANGKTTALGYNDRGFKTSMSDPDMGPWTYGYNALGELTTQTDAKSQVTTLQYDALGRLVQRTEPEGATSWVYDTGYGAGVGKPAFVLAPDGFMEAYAYDEYGAVTDTMRVIGDELYWVSQVYDTLGRPHATVYPDIQKFNASTTPGAPAFVSPPATSTGSHTLNWNETSDYAVYRLYRHQATTPNSSLAVEIYTGAGAGYQDSVSANGNNHYWVKACHAELCSALSAVASVAVTLPPEPPAYVTVPDYDTNYDGNYSVSWGASPTGGVTYEAHEDTDIAPLFGSPSTIYTGTALTKTRSGMPSGRYYYRVRACLGGNCSAWRVADASTLVELAPGNPGVPVIPTQQATTTFTASWSAASGSPSRYEVFYSTWNGSCSYAAETLAASPAGVSTPVTVPAFGNYCVRVRACRTSGQSDNVCSPLVAAASPDHTTAGPMPGAPGAMSVPSVDGDGAYGVSWGTSSGTLNNYELQEATNAGFTGATTTAIGWTETYYQCGIPGEPETCITPVAPATSLNLTGKTNGTTYYYRVRACQPWGCTAWSTGANGALVAFPPGVPASITVPATSTGSYTISWGASTGTVTAYELYESTSASFTTQTLVHSGTATSKAITKSASGTFYYRVRGCNSGQCSGYRTGGNSIVVTVSTAPSVPTLSTTTTFSSDGVYTISWTQSTGTVTAYELQQSTDGGAWTAAYTGTNLSKAYSKGFGTWEFAYQVRACNGANCSAYSNVVTVYVEHCGGMGCAYVLPPRPKLDEPEPDRLAATELDDAVKPDAVAELGVEETFPVGASVSSRPELVQVSGAEIEGFRLMPPPRPADLANAAHEAPVGASVSSRSEFAYHVGITPQPVPVTRPKPVKPLRQHALLTAKYLERGGRLPFKATKMAIGGGPTGTYAHKVMYSYLAQGPLHVVGECVGTTSCAMGTVYWRAQAADAAGRVIQERVGDTVVTNRGFDEALGTLKTVDTFKASGMVPLQDLDFTWDLAGNLLSRSEDLSNTVSGVNTRTEVFTYDAMLRLATSQVTDNGTPQTLYSHSHDPVGNLKTRAEATGYQYSVSKPHAVTQYTKSAVNYGFTYDLNGNVLTKTQGGTTLRQACWQSSNHPTLIAAGTITSCATGAVSSGVAWNKFSYAPDRSRYLQTTGTGGTLSTTTIYVGSLFEKEIIGPVASPTSVNYVHYIRGGGGVVGTFTRNVTGSTTTDTTEYWHRDHLGNVVFRTNSTTGDVVSGSRVQFDAWGKQLNGSLAKRNRGYTGHEHLTSLGLIHMNGRVYDPEVGRFLSPDTFVQFPESTQGFNRYTYVGNNPLSYSDPSGHFWVQAALLAYSAIKGYEQGGFEGALKGFAVAGFSAGMANLIGTAFQGVATANGVAASAAATAAAGSTVTVAPYLTAGQFIAKAALHGYTQGAISKAGGGRFGDGFLGGAAGSLTEGFNLPKGAKGVMAAAVIGGTVSKIGGGNFGNGAITAAFVRAFNYEQHMQTDEAGVEAHNPPDPPTDEARRRAAFERNVADRDKLEGLDPAFRKQAEQVLTDLAVEGRKLRVIWGPRTKAENDLLVQQDLASPTSKHLDRKALDFIDRRIGYDNANHPAYNTAVQQAAVRANVIWGGDFKTRWDPNHIEAR